MRRTIRIYPDLESLSRSAAEMFAARARSAVEERGRFCVALSGGETPRRTYQVLALPPFSGRVEWDKVHVFWGDERCVDPDDPRSNSRMADEALLGRVPVRPAQVHPIDCAGSPREGADRYEALLRSFFADQPAAFDLVLLGLGENGHTASLFPDTPVLAEQARWAAEVYVAEQGMYRVTLTAPLINQAAAVIFLVSGGGKAQVLKEVLEGKPDPTRLPAQLIWPARGELYWLVDEEAAALLKRA